jgi:hypothetical protein
MTTCDTTFLFYATKLAIVYFNQPVLIIFFLFVSTQLASLITLVLVVVVVAVFLRFDLAS